MQPFIRVHQLRQSFGTQEVLKGVSFDVGKGELMALIGGSGAGKSVILKHLDGLMDPLDGYVEIDGRRISSAPEKIKKQIRSKIGFMFQQGALFDSLSVGENVAFPLQEAGIRDENELDTRISAALDSVGAAGTAGKNASQPLQGGMIKRVCRSQGNHYHSRNVCSMTNPPRAWTPSSRTASASSSGGSARTKASPPSLSPMTCPA